jgi:hypothetical protein
LRALARSEPPDPGAGGSKTLAFGGWWVPILAKSPEPRVNAPHQRPFQNWVFDPVSVSYVIPLLFCREGQTS